MKKIIIEQKNVGQRIDRFLAREFFLYSRAEIIKKIKKGEVMVNNKEIKPSYILEDGNVLHLENFSKKEEDGGLFVNKEIPLDIVFENEDIIVINKQAGLQIHPSFNEKKNTLVNALLAKYPEIVNVHDGSLGSELRPGIVHRLDKDTTGVMVIARNMNSFVALKDNFKNRKIEKHYLAISKGIFKDKEGVIEKSLAKSSSYGKQVIACNNTKTTIREAETHYKILEEHGDYSLVEVRPKTGRTHQIRVHLASIGHPIVGDDIYGKEKQNIVSKQLLHSQRLKFILFEKTYEFAAQMPANFNKFLAKIRD